MRLFLIDPLTTMPAVLALVLLWTTGSADAGRIGTATTVFLGLLTLLLAVAAGVGLSALKRFFRRACVRANLGVSESIHRGFSITRQHLRDVAMMWVIMLGLGIVWAILMIPIVLLLVAVGVLLGGVPALALATLASLASGGSIHWILGAVVGLPIFVIVVSVPVVLLNGLWEAFNSSVWTVAYRQLLALETPGEQHARPTYLIA